MIRADAGTVLRRSLLLWGLGHLALGRTALGRGLIVAEIAAVGLLLWLVAGLAGTSAYLVPFLGGVLFLAVWAWQAVDAYRTARALQPEADVAPPRSEAVAIGWLAVPLLAWGAGFWLVAGEDASPAAVLDRFVVDWTGDELDGGAWDDGVVRAARSAARDLGAEVGRFRDVRIRIVETGDRAATAVAESTHFERRRTTFLGLFPGSELVPVPDEVVLRLELAAEEAELPGGGAIGAVRWRIVEADAGD